VKPLLSVYRVPLTGIHPMRTGAVEANLVRLIDHARLPHVADLIARKQAGPGASVPDEADLEFHRRGYDRRRAERDAARKASTLPGRPTARPALNDRLVRRRSRSVAKSST
jgi:hypothetical protein